MLIYTVSLLVILAMVFAFSITNISIGTTEILREVGDD